VTSLIVHFVIGIVLIAWVVKANPQIFARPANGPMFSMLEIVYYVVGIASVVIGYYFNHQFVMEYQVAGGNLFSGPASYQNFVALGYANPAAASASQDYTIVNVILLPLFTIVDGRRRGIRRPWLYFVISLFTSCAFAFAYYFAVVERQRRHEKAAKALNTVPA
jgi:Terpene cyclase DEP1